MLSIYINESLELPIGSGIIEIDSSSGPIIIYMKPFPKNNKPLIITKISDDNNLITLFSDDVLINESDIVLFGLNAYAPFKKGKIKQITLVSDGQNWVIQDEK